MVHQYMIKSLVMWLHILVVFLLMCVCRTVRECATVRHTHINKGKFSQFPKDQFENYINTVPDTLLFITDTTNICSHITTDLIVH